MSYIKYLKTLEKDWISWNKSGNQTVLPMDTQFLTFCMQQKFPGNYAIVDSTTNGKYGLKLVFDNEQEEVIFKLRYS